MLLLALDGESSYEPLGRLDGRRRKPSTRDVAGACLALGHALYRTPFAHEIGIGIDEWDRRVFSAWSRIAP